MPNDYVFEVASRYPDVMVPCVSVNPDRADILIQAAQEDITERRRLYEQLAGIERGLPGEDVNG